VPVAPRGRATPVRATPVRAPPGAPAPVGDPVLWLVGARGSRILRGSSPRPA